MLEKFDETSAEYSHNAIKTNLLKLRYQILIELLAFLIFLFPLFLILLCLPFFEGLEQSMSEHIVAVIGLFVIFLIYIINVIVVFYLFRYIFRLFFGFSNQQYKMLFWSKWYPKKWYKNETA